MSNEKRGEILLQVAQSCPSLLFKLIQHDEGDKEHDNNEAERRPATSKVPEWCICNNCREMPTMEEKKCCRGRNDNFYSLQPVSFIM